jgi:hypothetical protein
MSIIHVRHIKAKLEDIYSSKISLSDLRETDNKEDHFLTRSFAAYSLQVLANIDPDVAASSVFDSYDDNGIDAIYFDRKNKLLWILQSKWIKNGNGEPDTGEVNKFCKGIKDLIELQLDRFNEKIRRIEPEIIEALDNPYVKIRLVLAYTGNDNLSVHNNRIIQDLLDELNDPSELATFTKFSLNQSHKAIVGILEGHPIDAELVLTNWGKVEEPYQAIYGTICGNDLAQIFIDYRGKLFSENIRDFIGFSEVNEDILDTIQNYPENFYFYNNGITALCKKLTKKPLGGGDRQSGIFVAEDFKIVNGAQTVGTLGNAFSNHSQQVLKTSVLIKIISLENCPSDFGLNVTKKTNTQNRIDKRDFVSLDPEQERIKTELALEQINYHYKRTDEIQRTDDNNYYVEEVITSVACSLNNVDLAITAKREIGKLWEDITKKPYMDIINSSLSSTKIIRCVQIFRESIMILKDRELNSAGREKSHYIHSNRFLLHIIFQKIDKEIIMNPNYDFAKFKNEELKDLIFNTTDDIRNKVEELYATSLVHQIYRNFTKCREIKTALGFNNNQD